MNTFNKLQSMFKISYNSTGIRRKGETHIVVDETHSAKTQNINKKVSIFKLVEENNLAAVAEELQLHPERINDKAQFANSLLHRACKCGHVEMVTPNLTKHDPLFNTQAQF